MIAFLPDTQWYTRDSSPEFDAQMQWVVDHAADADKNIQMVLHEGDVMNTASSATELANADAAFDILDAAGMRYLICTGNHDYDGAVPTDDRLLVNYNTIFPQARFTGQANWSGAFYEAGHSENAYWLRTIGGHNYLFMSLEFGPRDAVLVWAAGIIDANPTYDVIILTHSFMWRDGTRCGTGDEHNPHTIMPGGSDCNDGDEMWAALKAKANFVYVGNGHDASSTDDAQPQAYRQDDGDNGNLVTQVLANYHSHGNGGEGYIRLVAIHPTANRVYNYTYSPHLDCWLRDGANEFVESYKSV
jgi:hypothetical protein